MVFTREDWIFSSIRVSLFWIRRVWGPIWMEIMRVSSRSWSFFSNREIMLARSLYAWASSWVPDWAAFFWSWARSSSRTCLSRFLPARIYMVSSL